MHGLRLFMGQVAIPGGWSANFFGSSTFRLWLPAAARRVLKKRFTNRDLMLGIHQVFKMYHEKLVNLPEEAQLAELEKIGAGMQAGMPPRENPLVHRCYDVTIGTGSVSRVRYAMYSHCPYQISGLLQAYAASRLLRGEPQVVGFQSPGQAFGCENFKGLLERFGYTRLEREH